MRTQCQRNEAILPLWWWRSVGGESYQRHPRNFSFVRWLSIYFRSLLFIQFFHCVQRRYPMLRSTTFDGRQKKFSGGQHMLSHVIYTRTHVELMECTGAHIFTSYQSVMEWAEEICQEENSLYDENFWHSHFLLEFGRRLRRKWDYHRPTFPVHTATFRLLTTCRGRKVCFTIAASTETNIFYSVTCFFRKRYLTFGPSKGHNESLMSIRTFCSNKIQFHIIYK